MPMPVNPAIVTAEKKIQEILLDLANEHGIVVETVDVDTRKFANCRVEIFERAPHSRV